MTPLFITLFVLAGLTDMVDGPLARKIKDAKSKFGADYDTAADLLMVVVGIFIIIPEMNIWPVLQYAIWAALAFKLAAAIPALIKHRTVFFLHTISNKILALTLFLCAIFYFITMNFNWLQYNVAISIYLAAAIVMVFIISVEEMFIISTLDYPHKDIRGFWQVKRINREYRESKAGK